MKKVLSFLRNYWLSILVLAIYVVAFTSYIIEPCALNIMLVILLAGVACIYVVRRMYKY